MTFAMQNQISTRPVIESDIPYLINYWLSADEVFLRGMGADISKLPSAKEWENMLLEQIQTPIEQKKSYCITWLYNNKPVGHSNVNKIIFGQEAFMHLHLWEQINRRKGLGTAFVRKTIPWFFSNLKLKTLYCEPFALNTAPNRTLEHAGFRFVKEYITTPGWINFEQPVNLWEMNFDDYKKKYEH